MRDKSRGAETYIEMGMECPVRWFYPDGTVAAWPNGARCVAYRELDVQKNPQLAVDGEAVMAEEDKKRHHI